MKVAISTVMLLLAVKASLVSDDMEECLKAHNDHHYKYHTTLNSKTVMNLEWSSGLTALAKTWAEGNIAVCMNRPGDDIGYGWSSVMRKGYTSELTVEWTLANWENKISLGYPSNGVT